MAQNPITPEGEEDPSLLYAPIASQINPRKVPWTTHLEKITPAQAAKILEEADDYERFGQRPRTPTRQKRWGDLLASNRFVEYHPFGPLGFNEDGVIMNGGNRLGALAKHNKSVGFVILRNCPTWLINYIDNGAARTQRESMLINFRKSDSETTAAIRLGMRYEEFLNQKRAAVGWQDWAKKKDEFVDIDNFMRKREYVTDLVPRGKLLKRKANLQAASGACFIAYQQLAWPEGLDKLEEFLDGLLYGAMLKTGNPALTLREWGTKDGFIGGYTHGRREGHLLLLFKYFLLFCEGRQETQVRVARGFPMTQPYHPDGWEQGVKNVLESLADMDREQGVGSHGTRG